jgi:putative membrane protein
VPGAAGTLRGVGTPGEAGADAGAEPGWQWLSPRSLVVRPVTDLIRLLPVVVGVYFFGSSRGSHGYWGLGFAALAILASIVRYGTTRYRITAERVYLRHGLLSQKVLSVPRDRIRSVDLSAHVVYRLLGLRKVQVGTGRNDRRDAGRLHLDALKLADAEALRAALLTAAPSAGPFAGAAPGAVPAAAGRAGAAAERELARLAPGWIRFAPFTLTGLVIVGVVVGTAVQVVDATHVNVRSIGAVRRLTVTFGHLSPGQRVLGGAAAALVVLVLLSVAGYAALFWNFRLVSQGSGVLRVSRGLLSTRTTTIDTRRLRGAELSEPLLLRAAGGARCLAITTGLRVGHGAERGGSLLLPPAPRAVATDVATAVLATAVRGAAVAATAVSVADAAVAGGAIAGGAGAGAAVAGGAMAGGPGAGAAVRGAAVHGAAGAGPADGPDAAAAPAGGPGEGFLGELLTGDLVRHGPAARRRRYVPAWAGLGSLVLLPAAAALAADRYRSLGHRLADGWLVTRTGSLIRRRSVLSAEGIIGWRIHQSWFQRRQGLVSLAATTAAGRQHYVAHDIPVATALTLATSVTGRLISPFRTTPGG